MAELITKVSIVWDSDAQDVFKIAVSSEQGWMRPSYRRRIDDSRLAMHVEEWLIPEDFEHREWLLIPIADCPYWLRNIIAYEMDLLDSLPAGSVGPGH